jgi:hypothetical protein
LNVEVDAIRQVLTSTSREPYNYISPLKNNPFSQKTHSLILHNLELEFDIVNSDPRYIVESQLFTSW